MSLFRVLLTGLALGLAGFVPGGAVAAPVSAFEADAGLGDFAADPALAPVFGANVLTISGSQSRRRDVDLFTLAGLGAKPEEIAITVSGPAQGTGFARLYLSDVPFETLGNRRTVLASERATVTPGRPATLTFDASSLGGDLHVAIALSGLARPGRQGLSYVVTRRAIESSIPGSGGGVRVTPLPPSLPLAAAACGALVLMRMSRRAG